MQTSVYWRSTLVPKQEQTGTNCSLSPVWRGAMGASNRRAFVGPEAGKAVNWVIVSIWPSSLAYMAQCERLKWTFRRNGRERALTTRVPAGVGPCARHENMRMNSSYNCTLFLGDRPRINCAHQEMVPRLHKQCNEHLNQKNLHTNTHTRFRRHTGTCKETNRCREITRQLTNGNYVCWTHNWPNRNCCQTLIITIASCNTCASRHHTSFNALASSIFSDEPQLRHFQTRIVPSSEPDAK